MVFRIAHDLDASAVGQNFVALGNGLARVVGALGLNVGTKLADEATDIRLIEDNDGIDVGAGPQ